MRFALCDLGAPGWGGALVSAQCCVGFVLTDLEYGDVVTCALFEFISPYQYQGDAMSSPFTHYYHWQHLPLNCPFLVCLFVLCGWLYFVWFLCLVLWFVCLFLCDGS